MDPDQALSDLRDIFHKIQMGSSLSLHMKLELAQQAAEIFEGLDEWLKCGGFPPKDWSEDGQTNE